MAKRDPRIDAYIAESADFAKPILTSLREVVHRACPDVEEGMKWSRPHFGHHGMMCGFAAFKAHCTFGFWKSEQVAGADPEAAAALERLGRLTSVKDLPPKKVIAGFVKKAMELNEQGVTASWLERRRQAKPKPAIPVPKDLADALAQKKHSRAKMTWEQLSPSHRREYLEWITEAKRPETRSARLARTLEWLAEGKTRNWKYM
jgi:uncharacterized protein YdeI (YjbR/CyaY-like superfamily)